MCKRPLPRVGSLCLWSILRDHAMKAANTRVRATAVHTAINGQVKMKLIQGEKKNIFDALNNGRQIHHFPSHYEWLDLVCRKILFNSFAQVRLMLQDTLHFFTIARLVK